MEYTVAFFGVIAALTFLIAMADRDLRGSASVICLACIAVAVLIHNFF